MYDPNYPVCLQTYDIGGGSIGCGYTSLAQCNGAHRAAPPNALPIRFLRARRRDRGGGAASIRLDFQSTAAV